MSAEEKIAGLIIVLHKLIKSAPVKMEEAFEVGGNI